jgi:hypothetical protein
MIAPGMDCSPKTTTTSIHWWQLFKTAQTKGHSSELPSGYLPSGPNFITRLLAESAT